MKKLLATFFIIAVLIGAMPKLALADVNNPGGFTKTNLPQRNGQDVYSSKNGATGILQPDGSLQTLTGSVIAPNQNNASFQPAQPGDNPNPNGGYSGGCSLTSPLACAQEIFTNVIQWVGNIILSTVSWVLWFAGVIFNFSIIVLVIHMKDVLGSIPAVFTVWQVLRDFANMFFIFILLYIAITTILGTKGWEKMLRNVVLVALFLNFSFFITGVLIDASNIVALQFYNGFAGSGCNAGLGVVNTVVNTADGCMSYKIVSALKLQTIYDTGTSGTNQAASTWIAASNTAGASMSKFLISIICGSILMIIIAGIFIASAIMIFYRFIELLVLLMISPLAFVSMVIPGQASTIWKRWSSKLVSNLIFAPAYFMFLWICMMVIGQGNLQTVLGATSGFQDAFSKGTDAQGVFGLLANYIIIIMLLGYSLKLAAELSAAGVKQATAAAKGFQGYVRGTVGGVGRNTIGKAAYSMTNSNAMREFSSKNPLLGRIVSKPLDSLGKQKFGSEVGYEKAMENRQKELVKGAKFVGETGLLVQGKGESEKDFNARKSAEKKAGQKRKQQYADVIGGRETYVNAEGERVEANTPGAKRTTILSTKLANALGITAALRSNKEATNDINRQIYKDSDEGNSRDKRDAQFKAALEDMRKLQRTMKYDIPTEESEKGKSLKFDDVITKTESQDDRISEAEDRKLAQIEADIGALDKVAQKDQLAIKLFEKKKIENRRKKFESLRNKINSIQDKLERENETDKITAAFKSGGTPPAPPAPKA